MLCCFDCRAAYQFLGFHDRRPGTVDCPTDTVAQARLSPPRPHRPPFEFATLEGRSSGGMLNGRLFSDGQGQVMKASRV